MWTALENAYLQILRIFFLITTTIAVGVFIIAFAMGINASIPRDDAYYSQNYQILRDKTNAIEYLSLFIPSEDAQYLKANVKLPTTTSTQLIASNDIYKNSTELFLKKLFGRSYTNQDGYTNEQKTAQNLLSWKKIYDSSENKSLSESKQSQYETNQLVWSLYQDFSNGLISSVNALDSKYKKDPIYDDSEFNKMTSYEIGTPPKWFYKTVNASLKDLEPKLAEKNAENVARKLEATLYFTVAGGAIGYFILVMFYFIFVKIERNLRIMSEKP